MAHIFQLKRSPLHNKMLKIKTMLTHDQIWVLSILHDAQMEVVADCIIVYATAKPFAVALRKCHNKKLKMYSDNDEKLVGTFEMGENFELGVTFIIKCEK